VGLTAGVERSFVGASTSIGQARNFAVEAADSDGPSTQVLQLVVSELATNAVLHAQSDFTVRVEQKGDAVTVTVCDGSTMPPVRKYYGPRAVTGRGIGIVEALVTRWGVTRRADGKCVWIEMPRRLAGSTA
jgi:anti-sigma regulatory factor (Ser/Thr protein kinase)